VYLKELSQDILISPKNGGTFAKLHKQKQKPSFAKEPPSQRTTKTNTK
jgi:hypothetical protein